MCGIAGSVSPLLLSDDVQHNVLSTLSQSSLIRRGPDSQDHHFDKHLRSLFYHSRLSIQDLSSLGNQPMVSNDKRYLIIFNGEIYNHLYLRQLLSPSFSSWKSHSDTETILEFISVFGVDRFLKQAEGMFAFCLLDRSRQTLLLARDRAGEKPLYYINDSAGFSFASDLKALKCFDYHTFSLDHSSIASYFKYQFIPAPFSIYRHVFKLIPGHYLLYSYKTGLITTDTYWENPVLNPGLKPDNQGTLDIESQLQLLHSHLQHSVQSQLLSDVPLGCFLSGGIDSSLVCALMKSCSTSKVKTFTIGFEDPTYNEAHYAEAVASHLNTDHHTLLLDNYSVIKQAQIVPTIYDEPFGDSSAIPTTLLAKFSSQYVKVCLAGDGGDELFCGYTRYLQAQKYFSRFASTIPLFSHLQPLVTTSAAFSRFLPPKLSKALYLISSFGSPSLSYLPYIVHELFPQNIVPNSIPHENPYIDQLDSFEYPSISKLGMSRDILDYLPNDLMVKTDRAAMHYSLETRMPFLSKSMLDFSLRLPFETTLYQGTPKYPLKQLLRQYLPSELIDRPKKGFGVPLGSWLRSELAPWANDLLSSSHLSKYPFLNSSYISTVLSQHMSGHNRQYVLWDVIALVAWLDHNES